MNRRSGASDRILRDQKSPGLQDTIGLAEQASLVGNVMSELLAHDQVE
jgi:hypothetical protein